ncbi:hypothetical protein PLESTF_000574400 [Pleodorina starrii]|nr:hypothetical protein PLESTM_002033700 [Pleodorina starrii]GLC67566.1 hypothetical protein PLESTF_000574400 [Pleodorina starrii]
MDQTLSHEDGFCGTGGRNARLRLDYDSAASFRSESSCNLVEAIGVVLKQTDSFGKGVLAVRQTCGALRDVYDQFSPSLCSCPTGSLPHPSAEEIEAAVHGILARGCKPILVIVALPWSADVADSERRALALLNNVAAAASVDWVVLARYTPLTEGIARAVARESPWLAGLHLEYNDYEDDDYEDEEDEGDARPPPAGPEEVERATAATRLLLQLMGPRLQRLTICVHQRRVPAKALDALSYCTTLTKLCIISDLCAGEDGLAAEAALLRTLPSLTALRELSLMGPDREPSDDALQWRQKAASLESCLTALTGLTSLAVCLRPLVYDKDTLQTTAEPPLDQQLQHLRSQGRHQAAAQLLAADAAEWRTLAAVAGCMPQLKCLHTAAVANLADMAALRSLTKLIVGAIALPKAAESGGEVAPAVGPPAAAGHTAAQCAPMYSLPPQLEMLLVDAPLPVSVAAAALQRQQSPAAAGPAAAAAPAAIGLHTLLRSVERDTPCWALEFTDHDIDRRLTAKAVAAMAGVAARLKANFAPAPPPWRACSSRPFDGWGSLHLDIRSDGAAVRPPKPPDGAVAGSGDGTHWSSWLGQLVSELRPPSLELSGFALTPHDMLSLGRHAPWLKALDLRGCDYPRPALSLLTGLSCLEQLQLDLIAGAYLRQRDKMNISAVFLSLTAPVSLVANNHHQQQQQGQQQQQEDGGYPSGTPLPLPCLRCLRIYTEPWTEALLCNALSSVALELQRRRPNPANLSIMSLGEE